MKPATRNRDLTRAELIEAAGQLFAEHGFEGCRNQMIADQAGVNKAMINYYFDGKEGLYHAVIEDAIDSAEPLLKSFSPTEFADGADALARWIEILTQVAKQSPYLPAILMREHLSGGATLHERYRHRLDTFYAVTRQILQHHRSTLAEEDPYAVHLSIIGALNYFLVTEPFRDEARRRGHPPAPAPSRDGYFHYLTRLFTQGLARTSPAPDQT